MAPTTETSNFFLNRRRWICPTVCPDVVSEKAPDFLQKWPKSWKYVNAHFSSFI